MNKLSKESGMEIKGKQGILLPMIYSPKYHLLNSRNFFKVARTSFSVFDDFTFERIDGRKRQAKATAAQKFVQFDDIMCEIDCNNESLKSQVNNENDHRNEQTQRVLKSSIMAVVFKRVHPVCSHPISGSTLKANSDLLFSFRY